MAYGVVVPRLGAMQRLRQFGIAGSIGLAVLVVLFAIETRGGNDAPVEEASEPTAQTTPEPTATPVAEVTPTPVPEPTPVPISVPIPTIDLSSVGQPQSNAVQGILTFRGNATRTLTGTGDAPRDPVIRWAVPSPAGLCEVTPVDPAEPRCGLGWTGQPVVFVREGRTWVVVGAMDGNVYFLDGASGSSIIEPFAFDGPVETTPTIDPDGLALAYVGGTDGTLRIISFDQPAGATELWRLEGAAFDDVRSSDDWDSSALVLGEMLVVGGENGRLVVVKLNKGTDADGFAIVDPEVVWSTPTWDDQLDADLGDAVPAEADPGFSVEASVAMSGTTVWVTNSAGLVQGWDLLPLASGGEPDPMFRFWLGDDADATPVVGPSGELFVGQLSTRATPRGTELGQLVRLDPDASEPLVWSFVDGTEQFQGFRSTVALHLDVVYATTNGGRVLAIDAETGVLRWDTQLAGPLWGSPVVVDGVLIVGDCAGVLRAWDVADTTVLPTLLWETSIGGCLEATPVVWDGVIYIGDRDGRIFAIADN